MQGLRLSYKHLCSKAANSFRFNNFSRKCSTGNRNNKDECKLDSTPASYERCKDESNQEFKLTKGSRSNDSSILSSHLTHVDSEGKVVMVDVGGKNLTQREARASACIYLGPTVSNLVKENKMKKGDVLTVAQIAGIQAAKQTSSLIPLCHNIGLTKIAVTCVLNEEKDTVDISSLAKTNGQTGVEMEALTAACVAALTIYDMCKAVTHDMIISNVVLDKKSGGKSDFNR